MPKLYICEIPIGNDVQNLRHNYNYYFGKNWKNPWSITGFYFTKLENIKVESVITVTGKVLKRSEDTINKKIPTGNIEILIEELEEVWLGMFHFNSLC